MSKKDLKKVLTPREVTDKINLRINYALRRAYEMEQEKEKVLNGKLN